MIRKLITFGNAIYYSNLTNCVPPSLVAGIKVSFIQPMHEIGGGARPIVRLG